jgi:Flp pilus assembly protein TadD
VKLRPSDSNLWNTLSLVYYRAGDWKGGTRATLKSMELSRGTTFWDWYILALCQWRLDSRERSKQLLVQAYRRTPPDAAQDPYFLELRDEAATLIGIRPTTDGNSPNDPSAYSLLLEIQPDAAWIYQARARECIRLKQWDQAAADLARVTQVRPKDYYAWYEQAAARLGAGDFEGYRKARQGIIANFRDDTNAGMVGHVCYVSAALPATPEETQTLLKMAEFAASRTAQNQRLQGAMNFRAGHYEAAIADFNRAKTAFPRRAWDWLFLAMAHQKLGQADEARKALGKAVEWLEQIKRRPGGGSTPTWVSWFEPLEVEQILKEARELIR